MRALLLTAVAALTFGWSASEAATFNIDDFATAQGPLNATSGTPVTNEVNGGGILGGYRGMLVDSDGANTTTGLIGSGALRYSNETNTIGSVSLSYDRNGTPGPGLGGVDVTDGGANDSFFVSILSLVGVVDISITVSDTSGNSATVSEIVSGVINTPGDTTTLAFSNLTGDPVNLTMVDTILLVFDTDRQATDATFQSFGTDESLQPIPLPASFPMLLAGLGALVAGARRRKQA